MRLPDASDRARAATHLDRSVVVTAGAGTGKTALLVERALNLLGSGLVDVRSLAAITFTEKAAAELRQRLAAGLEILHRLTAEGRTPSGGHGVDEAHRAYAWLVGEADQERRAIGQRALDALTDLDVASVSTIHAFCAEILRRHPGEAKVDPNFSIDEGPAFDRIFREAWDRFLESELGSRASRPELWRRALDVPDALEAIRTIARSLSSFNVPHEAVADGASYRAAGLGSLLGDEMRAVVDAIGDVRGRASDMNANMERFLDATRMLLQAAREGVPGAMESIAASLPFPDYFRKEPPSPGRHLTGCDPEEVGALARRGRDIVAWLRDVDEERIAPLVEAALPLAMHTRERLLASGLVSFDGLLRLTRDLLARRPEVRRSLAARYRAILVDEFQDTDPLQYEILFFIAGADDPKSTEAYALRLLPGRLFIVGDPKQSIYRFRGADIEAYRRAVSRVLDCGGLQLTLKGSFRSPEAILDPINRTFAAWMGESPSGEDPHEPRYDPIESARADGPDDGERVEIWSVESPGNVDARRSGEAESIARWIARDSRPSPETLGEPDFRPYAILLRALTQAAIYAQALRRTDIPFLVEGGRDFYERREVADLIAFLKAVVNRNDAAAVLAVLRGPLGAAPDEELARFALAGGKLDRAAGGLSDLGPFPNVGRALALLDSFRARTVGRPGDEVVRAALTETPLALLHASGFEGAQRVANLNKLVLRASGLARQGLPLERTLDALEEEFGGERAEGESPLADETVNAVRILSVHKAKGLEYPVVFVPDVGRERRHATHDGTDVAWVHRGDGHLAVRLTGGTTNLAWASRRIADPRHEAAEEKRVFYVACTRARDRLILINSNPGRKAAPWRDALAAVGYVAAGGLPREASLSGVRYRFLQPRQERPTLGRARRESPVWSEAADRFREVARSARASAVAPVRWPTGSGDDRLAAGGATADEGVRWVGGSASRDAARLAGTALHAALERWDFADSHRLRELVRFEARRAAREEVGGPYEEAVAAEVSRASDEVLEGFLSSSLPARLASLDVVGREVPVLYRDGSGVTWIGACDLVHRDRDGTIVLADYKTDRVEGDPTAFAERYRAQLTVYLEAFRRALPGGPVRGEILFLRTGTVVPL